MDRCHLEEIIASRGFLNVFWCGFKADPGTHRNAESQEVLKQIITRNVQVQIPELTVNLIAMASNLLGMASNLLAMASKLLFLPHTECDRLLFEVFTVQADQRSVVHSWHGHVPLSSAEWPGQGLGP